MDLIQKICPTCGAGLVRLSNIKYECPACGNRYDMDPYGSEGVYGRLQIANEYRENLDFTKAENLYRAILKDCAEPLKAEVYWDLFLCEQKTVFEEDGKNYERFPSFCDISPIEIERSDYFVKACEYAGRYDAAKLVTFKDLAKRMRETKIKYSLIKRTNKKPFEIFICFKKSDDVTGELTPDFEVAKELYNRLDGAYRVFFSDRTLNQAVVREYEPNIYSALYTSKVMLLLCSKAEYIKSQWVYNEWRRFLKMSKTTAQVKTIVPIFIDGFKPELLPDELRSMQGIDAGINLLADLSLVIKKTIRMQNDGEEFRKQLELLTRFNEQRNDLVTNVNNEFFIEAKKSFQKKEYDIALNWIDKYLQRQPDSREAKYFRAECVLSKSVDAKNIFEFIEETKKYITYLIDSFGTAKMIRDALEKAGTYQMQFINSTYNVLSKDKLFNGLNFGKNSADVYRSADGKCREFAEKIKRQILCSMSIADHLIADMFNVPGIKTLVEYQVDIIKKLGKYLDNYFETTVCEKRILDNGQADYADTVNRYVLYRYVGDLKTFAEKQLNNYQNYIDAKFLIKDGKYFSACELLLNADIYDSKQLLINCDKESGGAIYSQAIDYFKNGKLEEAKKILMLLQNGYPQTKDHLEKINEAFMERDYCTAVGYFDGKEYEKARVLFKKLVDCKTENYSSPQEGYKDSAKYLKCAERSIRSNSDSSNFKRRYKRLICLIMILIGASVTLGGILTCVFLGVTYAFLPVIGALIVALALIYRKRKT